MPDFIVKILQEQVVQDRRLGRHIHHDPRSLSYSATQADTIQSVSHAAHGLPFTQTRGSCTAESLIGALNTDPDFKDHTYTQQDAERLYDQEITLGGGNPSTDDPGGSGLLVCQAAKNAALITGYEHAFGLDHALKALTLRPVITGIGWYDSMDQPDSNGLVTIAPDAQLRGGHEVLATEILLDQKLVGLWNSWGDWGLQGRFYWTFDTWDRLLGEQGDVTVPIL